MTPEEIDAVEEECRQNGTHRPKTVLVVVGRTRFSWDRLCYGCGIGHELTEPAEPGDIPPRPEV